MPPISILDIIDIILVAFILYQLYRLIRGTAAITIFMGIFIVYLFWKVVELLQMELISSIMAAVFGGGVIILIIVFQQEIRRFLLMIGSRYMGGGNSSLERFFSGGTVALRQKQTDIEEIVRGVEWMVDSKLGAIIVIARRSTLELYSEGGEVLNARVSAELLKSIFYKGSPLHDGAVLIESGRVYAARCPLPATDNPNLPPRFGMRHRAAIGISELTDSIVIVISEERGKISLAQFGEVDENIKPNDLRKILTEELI
ncbi:MAG TPA: TIGR00159 family protein [Bacteroidales bacterium]|nr:TIGR00159 family protein [Bacteroidales bacterium]